MVATSKSLVEFVEGESPGRGIDIAGLVEELPEVRFVTFGGNGKFLFDDTDDGEEDWGGVCPCRWEVQGPKGEAVIYGHMETGIAGTMPRFHMFTGQYIDDPSANILDDIDDIRNAVAKKVKTWMSAFKTVSADDEP